MASLIPHSNPNTRTTPNSRGGATPHTPVVPKSDPRATTRTEAKQRNEAEPRDTEAAAGDRVLRLSRQHADMNQLVAVLSHDMAANFMLLESSFKQLKRKVESQPAPDQTANQAVADAQHVEACLRESKRLLVDLVTLARTGEIDMEPQHVELSPVVQDVLYEVAEMIAQRGVRVEVAEPLPAVWMNAQRVRQVIVNLVRNALRHGCDPTDGIIHISTPVHSHRDGLVTIEIHDNGQGIPAEARETIFLPGKRLPTAHAEGTGMGLAIVRKVIDHYGGTIHVDPACQQGTRFVLQLPESTKG